MLILLSPSKTLNFQSVPLLNTHTQPEMLKESAILIKELRKYTPKKITNLMGISDTLAQLNVQRYKDFATPFTLENARQALTVFKGDVYAPMEVESYTAKDFDFAQERIRILSGLYGLLKPLDLIQPYRLEMGTQLANTRGKSLYDFWGDRITKLINIDLKKYKNKMVINLASVEYFHSIKPELLTEPLLNIVFKERHKGSLKIIGLFAKKARGMMANFIIKQRIEHVSRLRSFNEAGYEYQPSLSNDREWVFVR